MQRAYLRVDLVSKGVIDFIDVGIDFIESRGRERWISSRAGGCVRAGQRPATVMDRIAKGFSDAEVQAIAAWYAQQH